MRLRRRPGIEDEKNPYYATDDDGDEDLDKEEKEIGRASCRERV